jgi:hypothetical protein
MTRNSVGLYNNNNQVMGGVGGFTGLRGFNTATLMLQGNRVNSSSAANLVKQN